MTIAERVCWLREDMKKPTDQTELGKKLNMSQMAVSRIETGNAHRQDIDIIEYCKFFKVSVDYILGLTDDHKPLSRK